MKKVAVVAITNNGITLGEKIAHLAQQNIDRFTLAKCPQDGWDSSYNSLSELMKSIFLKYQGIILIMATGIAVRLIAPLLTTKANDPAVVVMDEKNFYAISLVSGHLGGANSLASELGQLTGCQPIITTATDINNLKSIDVIAKELGLSIDPINHIKYFNKALLEGQEITFWAEKEQNIITEDFPWRDINNFTPDLKGFHGLITHRIIGHLHSGMIYLRPKSLYVGLGCRKGYSPEVLKEKVIKVFKENNLSLSSIAAIGTIDLKKEEEAIVSFAQFLKVPLLIYSQGEINTLANRLNLESSEFVLKQVGVRGVCEPCALLAGDSEELILSKKSLEGLTIAVAIKKPGVIRPLGQKWFAREERH